MKGEHLMESITIEQITIPYKNELLSKWKQRDPQIVPRFMLEWEGPGISNGYGFGEWMAERYFRDKGYYVFTNEFNLISKASKFHKFNRMIETIVSEEQFDNFKTCANISIQNGYSVENIDLFIYNLDNHFFAEVKKVNDKLREPQMRFIYLAEKQLEIKSKIIYLSDKATDIIKEELTFNFEIQL